MFKKARQFFDDKGLIEVDCPILSEGASIDAHIDLISAKCKEGEIRYLHSSPEFGMKRLLAEGMGDIYQLSHVFRDGEWSEKHNPEFTMAEWYRLDFSFQQIIEETIAFITLFLGDLPFRTVSYRDIFYQATGLDYVKATNEELLTYIQKKKTPYYSTIFEEGKDALLNLILGTQIEPALGEKELFVLAYYPATQAALAKKHSIEEELVAERFEVYYQGMELANGYHELTDSKEQRQRFEEANAFRLYLGKQTYPIDEFFLKALKKGLPDCCGVAVGFDRLMMLRQKQKQIAEVIPWAWNVT